MKEMERSVPWYHSLRFKLVAAAITIELLMLSALLANSFHLLNKAVVLQTIARLDAFSPLLDAALAGRVFQRDHSEIQAIIQRLTISERADICYIAVFDPFDALLASTDKYNVQTPPEEDLSIASALTDLSYDTQIPLTILGNKVGTVRFGISLASMVATQNQVISNGICIAIIEIFLSLLLLVSGGYLITRHIRTLINGTRRVAQGDYNTRISIPGRDEIAGLANDFNSMSAAVAARVSDLRASEMRFAAIFNTVGEAIFVHDATTGEILDVNQRMCEMYGYTHEEALKCTVSDVSANIPPYTQDEALNRLQAAANGTPQIFYWHARAKNKQLFWVEINLRLTKIGNDDRLIAVVRDISERKAAEEALDAEKERLAVTLRSIGDGVITTDTHGRIVLLNTVAENLTGWSQKEAQRLPLAEVLTIIHEKTRKPCDNLVEIVQMSGQALEMADIILIARDGTERQIAASASPIHNRTGQIIGVVLGFRDVTEKHRMEKELQKIKKLESIGVLAGGIAHDFNNILSGILGNISLAQLDEHLKENTRKLLSDAEKASLRAKDLTGQLLTFSKGGEPVKETSSIAEIIRDSADFVLHGANVACRYSLPDDLWLVDIDRGQISQVIQNIIINAKQAMPDGGTISVHFKNVTRLTTNDLSLPPQGRYIQISITDTGIGIPPDQIDKIFDPYFSTKQTGSGLGLTITYSIIKKHGGFITVRSDQGKGTTFTLCLPVSTSFQTVEDNRKPSDARMRKARIMIMDDEQAIRDVSEAMLMRLGHEVMLASNGEEAIELYRKQQDSGQPVDLIIMDLTIPGGMGGIDTARAIHAFDPEARMIVSSGYSNDPIMAHYQEYGFAATLAKPFLMQELIDALKQALK